MDPQLVEEARGSDDAVGNYLRARRGTFFPFLRASDSPMAIACLRLLTFPPRPASPRRSVLCLRRRIALLTSFEASREYCLAIVHSYPATLNCVNDIKTRRTDGSSVNELVRDPAVCRGLLPVI
jgi:hypothetical protein